MDIIRSTTGYAAHLKQSIMRNKAIELIANVLLAVGAVIGLLVILFLFREVDNSFGFKRVDYHPEYLVYGLSIIVASVVQWAVLIGISDIISALDHVYGSLDQRNKTNQ